MNHRPTKVCGTAVVGAGSVRHRKGDGTAAGREHHQEGHGLDEDEPSPDRHHHEVDPSGTWS